VRGGNGSNWLRGTLGRRFSFCQDVCVGVWREVVSRRDAGRDKVEGGERDVRVEKRGGGGGEKAGVVNVWESVSREARCVGG
jgi:hypothetical protein